MDTGPVENMQGRADFRPEKLSRHVLVAQRATERVTANLDDRIRALHGPEFNHSRIPAEPDPRNTWYQWVSYFLSETTGGVPKWSETTHLLEFREMVEAHKDALNRCSKETRLGLTFERLAVDYAIAPHAHAIVYPARRPGADRLLEHADTDIAEAYWPTTRRAEADHMLFDQDFIEEQDWRWTAHLEIRDISELEWENRNTGAKWDLDVLRRYPYKPGVPQAKGTNSWRQTPDLPDENVVAYWVMRHKLALPVDVRAHGGEADDEEHTPGKGYHGALFYMPWSFESPHVKDFVHPPEMYRGPEEGPHVFIGSMPVPGTGFRVPTLVANSETIKARSRYERSVNRAGELYKNALAIAGMNAGALAEFMTEIEQNGIGTVPSMDGLHPFELFGITPQMQVNLERLREVEDQAIGLSEEARGNASDGTATAASLAAGATSKRMGFSISGLFRGYAEVGKRMGWYIWNDERFVIDSGKEVQPGQERQVYVGGASPGARIDYEDLDAQVQYYSTRFMSEAQMREQLEQLFRSAIELFPGLPQIGAHIRVDELVEKLDELGMPGLEHMLDKEGLAAAVQLFMQGQAQASQSAPEQRHASTGAGAPQTRMPQDFSRNGRPPTAGAQVPDLNNAPTGGQAPQGPENFG